MSVKNLLGAALACWIAATSVADEPATPSRPASWLQSTALGTFSLQDAAGKRFIVDGSPPFCGDARFGNAGPAAHPTFGAGEQVETQTPDGRQVRFSQHPALPFTLIQATLKNIQAAALTTRSIDLVTLPIELGVPTEELKVLGTGGLTTAGEAPGSYMWMAIAHPATRRGVVIGWLSSQRGSGVLLPRLEQGRLTVTARLEFGQLTLPADHSESLEQLVVGVFDDARLGLEAYADATARLHSVRLKPAPCGYCTWYHAGASNAKALAQLTEYAARELAPFGLSFIQIDDGWQKGQTKNGPRKNFTAHQEKGPYPRGMQPTAADISGRSLTPGLWLMPFAGTWDDPFFADRQDWFARRSDGSPFDTFWGGSCFDLTRPQVQDYLRENIDRVVHEWGYRYLKMDGVFTGAACDIQYVNDAYKDDQLGNATLFNTQKTHIEALREGLHIVRQAAGEDVFLLGCCAPQNMRSYGGTFGLVDAMRIGPDNGANVEGLVVGPRYGSRNYFLNGRLWWNDPDPVYVRQSLSRAQAELSCTWAAVAGQLTVASDQFDRLPAERIEILKRVMPTHTGQARPVDLFDRELPRVWTVRPRDPSTAGAVVGLFNWEPQAVEIDEPMERLGLDPAAEYSAYEFWSNRYWPAISGRLSLTLESLGDKQSAAAERAGGPVRHCCAVLALRPVGHHPQLLSTSRHVTQGLVDVREEVWDAASNELRGISRVVKGDPYELRITTPTANSAWKVARIGVSKEDEEAGVAIEETKSEAGLVRIAILSAQSRDVRWTIQFTPRAD